MPRSNASQTVKELKELIAHAQKLVDATHGDLDEATKSARETLQDRIHAVTETYQHFGDSISEGWHAAEEYVHQKPFQIIGGTFLVGLVLGWLFSRR